MTKIQFLDEGPDEKGWRKFFLYWRGCDPVTGLEGWRGQIFHKDPQQHLDAGAEVVTDFQTH